MLHHRLPTASSQEVICSVDSPEGAAGSRIDATALARTTALENPKLWNQPDFLLASSFSDDDVQLLIRFLASPCDLTRLHALRCLSFIIASANHHLSPAVFASLFDATRRLSFESRPDEDAYLFRQCFYTVDEDTWTCPICLVASPLYVTHCVCCYAPRLPEVHENSSKETYMQNRLHYATARLYLQCLLVMSRNPAINRQIEVGDVRQILQFMRQSDPLAVIICTKLLWACCTLLTGSCNILDMKRHAHDDQLLNFLQQPDIYSTIHSALTRLASVSATLSRSSTVLILSQFTWLIQSIYEFDRTLRRTFTINNGIEIALSIFNFPLPTSQRETVIGFVRPLISDLWGSTNDTSILCNCTIHQLMTLLLWAVNNDVKGNEAVGNMGKNAIQVLKSYAEKNDQKEMDEKQELLLKFGVPRLLVLFAAVLSYGKFMKLECAKNRMDYCKDVVVIIHLLSSNLVPFASPSHP